jgi:aspartyl-tRNA(Asn)/glutamyl-tRNA(Gln) amidotransferase subunit B
MSTSVATDWEMVIGLEVHAELLTKTKLFSSAPNEFGAEPNTNIDAVVLGLPGSLPVLNKYAVELAIRVGLALHCEVRPSIFHRKNYFYPDMPKDYQISQYDQPLNAEGYLELPDGRRIGIERAHMEEDTGKITHVGGSGRIHDANHSVIDYNRAGVPLVEIVSRPDLRNSEDAKTYVAELRAILVAIGASDGKMEEGSMRVDANVSVRPRGTEVLGTRCEIKNLNSLRSLGRAIEYEAQRQIELLEGGGRITQETRHWNDEAGSTSTMRSKEEAHDYRYFPEPDLVPLAPSAEWINEIRNALPRLPADRRRALADATGVTPVEASLAVEQELDELVMQAIARGANPRLALARATNELAAAGEQALALGVDTFVSLLALESAGSVTATQSKAILAELIVRGGGDAASVAAELGFEAVDESVIAAAVDAAIEANPGEWGRYCDGEDKLTGFFTGQVMKGTQGKADGKVIARLLSQRRSG